MIDTRHAIVPLDERSACQSGCGALYSYWRERRGDCFAPSWRDIDLMMLPSDLVPFVQVIDIQPFPFNAVFRYWGTGLAKIHGVEMTGRPLLAMSSARAANIIAEVMTVMNTRRPIFFQHVASGKAPARAAGCRLPLSNDGIAVSHVIAVTDFRRKEGFWRDLFEDIQLIRINKEAS